MPSFADSAVIFVLALLLFGPKKLPELARYLGKLMGEFRRASAEFRLQMDDEFRAIENAQQQAKISAIEAAAPISAVALPEPEHPHTPSPVPYDPALELAPESVPAAEAAPAAAAAEPLPIASNGDLHLMPPATGLPVSRSSSLAPVFDAIPHTESETTHHG